MDISVTTSGYGVYGGTAFHAFIGEQLMLHLGNYGEAVNSMEIRCYLRSVNRNPRKDKGLFDYCEYLKALPRITFRRKLKRVEIEFLSEHCTLRIQCSAFP